MKARFLILALVLFVVCGCGALPSATPTLPPPKNPSLPETSPTPAPSPTVPPADTQAVYPSRMPDRTAPAPGLTEERPPRFSTQPHSPFPNPGANTAGPSLMYLSAGGARIGFTDSNGGKMPSLDLSLPRDVGLARFGHFEVSPDRRWFSIIKNGNWWLGNSLTGQVEILAEMRPRGDMYESRTFSPDNRWFGYLGGYFSEFGGCENEEDCRLALKVRSLDAGRTVADIPLLDSRAFTGEEFPGVFFQGIGSMEWSPNGRYLAFVGAPYGNNTDLFLFDTVTLTSSRLTDGPAYVTDFWWTPDSRFLITYGTPIQCPDFMRRCDLIYRTPVDGSPSIRLDHMPCPYSHPVMWISATRFLCGAESGLVTYDLVADRTMKAADGEMDIWDYDLRSGTVLFSRSDFTLDPFLPELHLYFAKTGDVKGIAGDACHTPSRREDFWLRATGHADSPFTIRCSDGTLLIRADGASEKISGQSAEVSLSPISGVMLLYEIGGKRISLQKTGVWITGIQGSLRNQTFNPAHLIFQNWNDMDEVAIWRPDGLGVFLLVQEGLIFIDVEGGDPVLVDPDAVGLLGWVTR